MPELVYPGVYVEELGGEAGSVHPIPGVPLDDAALESISKELRRAVAVQAPQWTSSNESDPGITLVELLAFLGESLRFRAGSGGGSGSGLRRPMFFAGRLLDAAALTQEQDYQREKRRRHDLALIGSGVVSGLGVIFEPGGSHVVVEPGYAIDARGEEIWVPGRVTLALPPRRDSTFVTIRFWEKPCPPSWIEEACILSMAAEVVPPALGLARLARGETGWFVDPAFVMPRIHR